MSVDTASRLDLKRSHDTFEELGDLKETCSVPADYLLRLESEEQTPTPHISKPQPEADSMYSSNQDSNASTKPVLDTARPPPTVSALAALDGITPPPSKKPKLSFQEKEMKRINKEIKDREKAEEKARKEQDKATQAVEKARRDAEKEAERLKREAEKAEREAEKKRKDIEKEEKRAAMQAERTAREEKRRKIEDDKTKKEKGQRKLTSFLPLPSSPSRVRANSADSRGRTSASPAPQNSSPSLATRTPSKPKISEYEKAFPAFFVQNGVTLAPINRFERDLPATEYTERNLDSYLSGAKILEAGISDAASLFNLLGSDLAPRGIQCTPVREIMEEFYTGKASKPIDLTTDSQNTQIRKTQDHLRKIPMKFLKFREDVRPPYRGTYTTRPKSGTHKLARNPLRKDLPYTDYDYDSEAEWVEDDGEDLKSGDEDEEIDDDEDMDGFLDDENDELALSKRLVLQGDLEPVSTGLCWEDRKKRSTNVKMVRYRMEVILDRSIKSIDPFSTSYWQLSPTAMEPPRIPLNSLKTSSLIFNATPHSESDHKPIKSFFTKASDPSRSSPAQPSASGVSTSLFIPSSTKDTKPKKFVTAEDMEDFKNAIVGSDLTKIGLIEVLKKKFTKHPGAAIKATLEAIAKRGRPGEKNDEKRWYLVDGNENEM